ncbi:MAG: (d)CMP kinase [Anderseniella sp.]
MTVRPHLIIAVDGPAASGKGTLARRLAAYYGLSYLDTGSLYRATGLAVEATGARPDDQRAALKAVQTLDPSVYTEDQLRSPGAGEAASQVAAIPQVRSVLLEFQRNFAATPPGAVLDGRDIGTVVCPDADAKLFVTAQPETRAQRRHLEHAGRGDELSYENVLADIRRRDERDSGRAVAPLKPAEDAILLDTTELGIEAAFQAALDLVESVLNERGQSA